jgi:Putative tail fiber protein gp53-like, C-terminal
MCAARDFAGSQDTNFQLQLKEKTVDYPSSANLYNGKFTDGIPASGIAASNDPAAWANAVTDELLNLIAAGNVTKSEAAVDNVKTAILNLFAGTGSSATKATTAKRGVSELSTDAEAAGLSDSERVMTPANLGPMFSRSLAANGYQKLPGGLIFQWGKAVLTTPAGSVGQVAILSAVTFPVAFPSACASVVPVSTGPGSDGLEGREVTSFVEAFAAASWTPGINRHAGSSSGAESLAINWIAIGY